MIAVSVVACLGAIVLLVAGAKLTEVGPWYLALRKPAWQPPDWAFGPIWVVVLGLAAVAFVLAWQAAPDAGGRGWVAGLFAVNAVLHLLWSPLFFKLRRPDWAMMEVLLLWLSVLALIVGVAPYSRLAAWLLAPYLVWVSIAMSINWAILRLNGSFASARA